MPGDRSFHLIEAVADRIEGAPVAGRRRWSDAFKAEMAARSCEAGANVSALAREIGISPSQLFGWRSVLIRKGTIERRDAAGCGVSCEPPDIDGWPAPIGQRRRDAGRVLVARAAQVL